MFRGFFIHIFYYMKGFFMKKQLLALLVLASTSVFCHEMDMNNISCDEVTKCFAESEQTPEAISSLLAEINKLEAAGTITAETAMELRNHLLVLSDATPVAA